MLRRQPTRIELKPDDMQELEQAKERERAGERSYVSVASVLGRNEMDLPSSLW